MILSILFREIDSNLRYVYMQVNVKNMWTCRHRNWSYDPRDKTSFDVTALYRIDWHDPPRYDKWLYMRDESVIAGKDVRTRKTRECTYIHGYTRGTGWRGRVDAVRPCHDTTIRTRVWNIVVLRGEKYRQEKRRKWTMREKEFQDRNLRDPDCLGAKAKYVARRSCVDILLNLSVPII